MFESNHGNYFDWDRRNLSSASRSRKQFFQSDCNEYLIANCSKLVSYNAELMSYFSILHIPFYKCHNLKYLWKLGKDFEILMSISSSQQFWTFKVTYCYSNKSTNQMQLFFQFITWRLFTAQHVSGVLTSIIKSSTTAVAASDFTFGV